MAYLDEKTTQAISKFTIDDVSVVTEKETLKIADADREMRSAYALLNSDSEEPKEVTEQTIQVNIDKINSTLSVLFKIGAFSKDFNAVILKGFATLIKSEPELSEKTTEAIKTVCKKLMEIRNELDADLLTITSEPEDEVELDAGDDVTAVSATELETLKADLEACKAENEKMKGKISSLHERLKNIEKQAKLFMYCGLGVAVITLLSLIFSIVALAK